MNSTLQFNADNFGTKSKRPSLTWEGKYATAILGDGVSYLVQGTTLTGAKARTNTTVPVRQFMWGGQNSSATGYSKGLFHSVRIYNRALTEAELVQNRKVDEIRFRGNFADYANLIVVNGSSIEGAETSLPAGEYELTGSLTITAADVRAGGTLYRSKVRVETWDGSAWVDGGKQSGNSYTATDTARVRLTYTWERSGFMLIVR